MSCSRVSPTGPPSGKDAFKAGRGGFPAHPVPPSPPLPSSVEEIDGNTDLKGGAAPLQPLVIMLDAFIRPPCPKQHRT